MPGVSDPEIDQFYSIVGRKIKFARGEAGISQTVLAQRIGFNRSSIANLEAGRQRIGLHLFFLISEAIGVSPAALLPDISLLEEGSSTTAQTLDDHLAGATEASQDFVRETIARAIVSPHNGGN